MRIPFVRQQGMQLYYILKWIINGLCTENRLRSQRTKTPYKIKVNNCKLIDLVITIELFHFPEILMPWFSFFFRNSIIHFRMFLYLKKCFLRVAVSLPCRLQAVSKIHVPISLYLISEINEIFNPVIGTATKSWLSGNMLPDIKTCKNGWSKFAENLIIVALKLLGLTWLLSPNLSIYSYLL